MIWFIALALMVIVFGIPELYRYWRKRQKPEARALDYVNKREIRR